MMQGVLKWLPKESRIHHGAHKQKYIFHPTLFAYCFLDAMWNIDTARRQSDEQKHRCIEASSTGSPSTLQMIVTKMTNELNATLYNTTTGSHANNKNHSAY